MPALQLLIDGQWTPSESGATLEVHNPANGSLVGSAALGTRCDVQRALEAAQTAFQNWKNTTGDERSRLLKRAAQHVADRRDELARLLTSEHGKPLADALKEIDGAAGTLELPRFTHRLEGRASIGGWMHGGGQTTKECAVSHHSVLRHRGAGWSAQRCAQRNHR